MESTSKVTVFDRETVRRVREAISEHLRSLGDELGVKFTAKGARYDTEGRYCTFQVEAGIIATDGQVESERAVAFQQLAHHFGLDPTDLGHEFRDARGRRYRIVGLRRKARKNPIIVHCLDDGADYAMCVDHVREGLERSRRADAGEQGLHIRLKTALLDEDPWVREAAVEYFRDSWSRDPDLVSLILQGCERFGNDANLHGVAACSSLLLNADAVEKALEHLERTEENGVVSHHLKRALLWAPVDLLAAREQKIRNHPRGDREWVRRIERRCELATWSADDLWKELQSFARSSEDKQHVGEIDHFHADSLVDALARHDVPDAATICRMLAADTIADGWLEIFLIDLAGKRRLAEAIPVLVDKFHVDTDYMLERCSEALARIGDPEAIRLIRGAFPSAESNFRLYTASLLGKLKHPESEEAILHLLDGEKDATVRTDLCFSLCRLFSERGVEAVRREIVAGYDRWLVHLEEELLPVLDVLGADLPEAGEWRREREERRLWQAKRMTELEEMGQRYQALQARGIDPLANLAGSQARTTLLPADAQQPLVRQTPFRQTKDRVGRNDPCPCGSGKKFKKCCARSR